LQRRRYCVTIVVPGAEDVSLHEQGEIASCKQMNGVIVLCNPMAIDVLAARGTIRSPTIAAHGEWRCAGRDRRWDWIPMSIPNYRRWT
jgi:hypothetical protein